MPSFHILCLANSTKLGGSCIAGLRTDGQGWLRPVAPSEDGTLLPRHYRLNDGTQPQKRDILEIHVEEPCPQPHQPENWVISSQRWKLIARPAPDELIDELIVPAFERSQLLFGDDSDRLSYELLEEQPIQASLTLVYTQDLELEITENMQGNLQARAIFNMNGTYYNLVITDTGWKKLILKSGLPEGVYEPQDVNSALIDRSANNFLLTISLGQPFNGFCYKLVAGIAIWV